MSIVFLYFWKKKDNLTRAHLVAEMGGASKGLLETVAVFSDNMKRENKLSKYSGMDKETV